MTEEKPLAEPQVTAEAQVVSEEQSVTAETTTAKEQPVTMTAETTIAPEKPMAEEKSKLAQGPELNAPWWSGTQRLAAWYIDISERLARRALDVQEQTTGWAKDTPWAPLFQAQHTLASQWVDGSVTLARNFWRLEQAEEAAKKAEGEAERQ